jgi:hypothetical protein
VALGEEDLRQGVLHDRAALVLWVSGPVG